MHGAARLRHAGPRPALRPQWGTAGAHEGGHEAALDRVGDRVHVQPGLLQEAARVLRLVDARRLDLHRPRSRPPPAAVGTRAPPARRPRTPTHSSMLRRTSAGTSPRTTTSETAKRPPGFSTRNASRSTCRLSAERLITQFEMITSTRRPAAGCLDLALQELHVLRARLARVAPAPAPASRRSCPARTPCPVGPTRFAERSTSMPPPEPRSSTTSPSRSSASAVGLPQPSDASTAASGSAAAVQARVVQVARDRIRHRSGGSAPSTSRSLLRVDRCRKQHTGTTVRCQVQHSTGNGPADPLLRAPGHPSAGQGSMRWVRHRVGDGMTGFFLQFVPGRRKIRDGIRRPAAQGMRRAVFSASRPREAHPRRSVAWGHPPPARVGLATLLPGWRGAPRRSNVDSAPRRWVRLLRLRRIAADTSKKNPTPTGRNPMGPARSSFDTIPCPGCSRQVRPSRIEVEHVFVTRGEARVSVRVASCGHPECAGIEVDDGE
jgi:hypothetical protein